MDSITKNPTKKALNNMKCFHNTSPKNRGNLHERAKYVEFIRDDLEDNHGLELPVKLNWAIDDLITRVKICHPIKNT